MEIKCKKVEYVKYKCEGSRLHFDTEEEAKLAYLTTQMEKTLFKVFPKTESKETTSAHFANFIHILNEALESKQNKLFVEEVNEILKLQLQIKKNLTVK